MRTPAANHNTVEYTSLSFIKALKYVIELIMFIETLHVSPNLFNLLPNAVVGAV